MKLFYARASLKDARIVICGFPVDKTSSFLPGTRFGPMYIRYCSENIEFYSPYQKRDLQALRICDLDDLIFKTSNWSNEIKKFFEQIFDKKKKFIFLGGEHTISFPVIEVLRNKYKKFSVIHFDAHADLRDEYLGEKLCHATVMRRVAEIVSLKNVYQFGIRSGTEKEFRVARNLYKFDVYKPLRRVINRIPDPLYISIDVDVLDPAALPAVSTPAPGGISFQEMVDSIMLLKNRDIIAVDIVEYNPLAATPYVSGTTVAELLREIILIIGHRKITH